LKGLIGDPNLVNIYKQLKLNVPRQILCKFINTRTINMAVVQYKKQPNSL